MEKLLIKIKKIFLKIRHSISQKKIMVIQFFYLRVLFSKKNTSHLIVFLSPGIDDINGGILSISSLYEESRKFKEIHQAEVLLCSFPSNPNLLKYTKFSNNNIIYNLDSSLHFFKNLISIQIHIPEMYVSQFIKDLEKIHFKKDIDISFNILLQNIDLLGQIDDFDLLKKIGSVTCTTAHQRYSTLELRKKLGVPLHKLSTYVSSEQYEFKHFHQKQDLMIISPDEHPEKQKILNKISDGLPHIKMIIIKDMNYEKYKKIIATAKWAITFGEGFDNYFIEPIFCGGISFSVYNSRFFPEEFQSLKTVYFDNHVMMEKICDDILFLNNQNEYENYQKALYNLCSSFYNYEDYKKNLQLFYSKNFTFP